MAAYWGADGQLLRREPRAVSDRHGGICGSQHWARRLIEMGPKVEMRWRVRAGVEQASLEETGDVCRRAATRHFLGVCLSSK